jgi:GTPase
MFIDTAKIYIKSGNGGDGHVSFRRELYVPSGGPDGGDGGKGGDVIFQIDEGLNTLSDFRHIRKYHAQNGEPGGKRRCHGKNGSDIVVKVPNGTVIKDDESGLVIADMSGDNRSVVVLKGGNGGLGNMHFATSTMQAPRYAKPGQAGIELTVRLELKILADVGLIGFPNVGKSTLLTKASNARPQIANYHFTTINPHLGVVDLDGNGFVMADIPGLIEGASDGAGLGFDFLRHIERCKVLVHVVDIASTEGRDPVDDINKINAELSSYDESIMSKPQIIVANKIDQFFDEDSKKTALKKLEEAFGDRYDIYTISAISGEGVKQLLYHIRALLDEMPDERLTFASEYDPMVLKKEELPFEVKKEDGIYIIEGPRIEKMLGYTNLESEKGFMFFQDFMKKNGILDMLEELGIVDGDTVKVYGHEFDYYK